MSYGNSLTFDSQGKIVLYINAAITIAANQSTGNYSGTYNLSFKNSNNQTFSKTGLTMNATIVSTSLGVQISEKTRMCFGEVATGKTSSSVVTLSQTTGAVTVTSGDAFAFSLNGNPASSKAEIYITGNSNTTVTASLSSSGLTGPSGTLTLNNFAYTPTGTSLKTNYSGYVILNIGARVTIPANSLAGTYNGTYTIIANYA
jgi:hypothetical protein